MKKFIYIVLVSIVFLGCAKKVEVEIPAYTTLNQNTQQNIKVNFLGVSDQRGTDIISTVYEDDKIIEEYPLSNNLQIWYQEALIRELQNSDMYDISHSSFVDVMVNIKTLQAKQNKLSMDKKNLKVKISLELVIKKGTQTVTSTINMNQTRFKPIILDAGGFEDILSEAMGDSVSKTISVLIEKLKN